MTHLSVYSNDNSAFGFTFTWSIQNFSECVQKEDEYIDSPGFELKGYIWDLHLFPKGDKTPGFISCYVRHESYTSARRISYPSVVNTVLSIQASNGLFKTIGEQTFNPNSTSDIAYQYSFEELYGPDAFLDNDTLTLRCRIWENENDPIRSLYKITQNNGNWFIFNDLCDSDGYNLTLSP